MVSAWARRAGARLCPPYKSEDGISRRGRRRDGDADREIDHRAVAGAGVSPRRTLQIADLEALAEAVRAAGDPPRIFRAVESLSAQVIGHRLFTVMALHAASIEVERVHTSMPSVYPLGGRKAKARTPWADHVLGGMQVFRAGDPAAIREAFDDHATILGLGLGSILNIPIGFQGRCVGTMNLLHEAGWYTPQDERTGLLIGAFLAPALLDLQSRTKSLLDPVEQPG
jgi:hypothetical protein